MNRAQQIIKMYEETVAPKMTDLGNDVVKQVDTLAKSELKKLNPVLKWSWAGHLPSEQQRKSDNLEWKLALNSHTHGDELTSEFKDWAETTLTDAINSAFAAGPYTVQVTVKDATFPKPDDNELGDMRLVSVMVRLDDLKDDGLTESATALTTEGKTQIKNVSKKLGETLKALDPSLVWDAKNAKNTAMARKAGFSWSLDFWTPDDKLTPEYLANVEKWANGPLKALAKYVRSEFGLNCSVLFETDNETFIDDGMTLTSVEFRVYNLKKTGHVV